MARITVEDCLDKVNNRFTIIHMTAKRVRQLKKGAEPTVSAKNRDVVIALREIAAGNIISINKGTVMAPVKEGEEEVMEEDAGNPTGGKQPC
jgi:DNA-directed RNA polymerase subunit omega